MAAKPKRRAGDDELPHELWRDILNRLPVKSILRFRSVCKSWYSLISCPSFISGYSIRNLNKNGNHVLLQVCNERTNVYSYSSYDESFMESCEHDDFPEPFRSRTLRIVGSCNGLICLSKYDCCEVNAFGWVTTLTLLIRNPTIKKVVDVPPRTFCLRTQRVCRLGFGFDFKTNDYKVVCASRYSENGDLSNLIANVFEIFDLRKGAWRVINPLVASWEFEYSDYPECYHDGSRDWILLSFNMSDELFREIRLPEGFIDGDNSAIQTRSVTSDGLIHLIAQNTRQVGIDVWAMKEYGVIKSWTKLFSIDLQRDQLHLETIRDFCFWKNGEVLIVHTEYCWLFARDGELLSYNIESRKYKRVFSITKQIGNMCLFEESLVLM